MERGERSWIGIEFHRTPAWEGSTWMDGCDDEESSNDFDKNLSAQGQPGLRDDDVWAKPGMMRLASSITFNT